MKTRTTQKGFTLVELAIVMTIIGLLIGGVLKGQELMQNARVTSTVAQIKAYEAAVTTFRDKYDAVPGDMTNATTRIPGCAAAVCNAAGGAQGDGNVGALAFAGAAGAAAAAYTAQTTTTIVSTGAATTAYETHLFWAHLLLADLIGGITNASVVSAAGVAPAWGTTMPAAKIAGGFVVGYGNGNPGPGASAVVNSGVSGMMLALVPAPLAVPTTTAAVQPLTATRAAQIDRKMDDGLPSTGYVQAYGVNASCNGGLATLLGTYLESVKSNDCGLIFRIQG